MLLSISGIGLKTIWIFQEEPTTSDIFFKFYNDNGDSCISILDNFIKVTIFFFLNKISNHGFYIQLVTGSVIFQEFNFFMNREWIVKRQSEYKRTYCAFLKQARRKFHLFQLYHRPYGKYLTL